MFFRCFVKISERNTAKPRGNARFSKVRVRDYLPLQQGLRRPDDGTNEPFKEVRDYLPLQQGLRLL